MCPCSAFGSPWAPADPRFAWRNNDSGLAAATVQLPGCESPPARLVRTPNPRSAPFRVIRTPNPPLKSTSHTSPSPFPSPCRATTFFFPIPRRAVSRRFRCEFGCCPGVRHTGCPPVGRVAIASWVLLWVVPRAPGRIPPEGVRPWPTGVPLGETFPCARSAPGGVALLGGSFALGQGSAPWRQSPRVRIPVVRGVRCPILPTFSGAKGSLHPRLLYTPTSVPSPHPCAFTPNSHLLPGSIMYMREIYIGG